MTKNMKVPPWVLCALSNLAIIWVKKEELVDLLSACECRLKWGCICVLSLPDGATCWFGMCHCVNNFLIIFNCSYDKIMII